MQNRLSSIVCFCQIKDILDYKFYDKGHHDSLVSTKNSTLQHTTLFLDDLNSKH